MLLAGLGAGLWTVRYLLTRHAGRGRAVRVAVPSSGGEGALSEALARAGVISHPWAFRALLWVTGADEGARAGATLVLRDDLTPRVVLRTLASGRVWVTVPEGYTRFDVARRLEAAGVTSAREFLARTEAPEVLARYRAPGPTLEGFLYPDTYDFDPQEGADGAIDRMVRLFHRRFRDLVTRHPEGVARAAAFGGERAIVVLASLIERETGAAEDRAHVASVFWNRLTLPTFRPRLLQSDPTILYGCLASPSPSCGPEAEGGRRVITSAMLADEANPYNTYRHEGLPPGPVCNPGRAALTAALAPTSDQDLYFVARGDGRSAFAATLEDHRRNVRRYLHPDASVDP